MARPRDTEKTLKILNAAQALLRDHGYMAVSMEAVAERAGVGKQTVYRWWPTKADLFLELYEHLVPSAALNINTGSVRGDLIELLSTLFDIYRRTHIGRALAGLAAELPRNEQFAGRMRESFLIKRRDILSQLLMRGIERGEIQPDIPISLVTDTITGAIWFRVLMEHEPLDDHFAKSLADQIFKGAQLVGPN